MGKKGTKAQKSPDSLWDEDLGQNASNLPSEQDFNQLEDDFGGLMSTLRKGSKKKKQQQLQDEGLSLQDTNAQSPMESSEIRIKTKKEKEKEKKERDKARKKEQLEKKKTAAASKQHSEESQGIQEPERKPRVDSENKQTEDEEHRETPSSKKKKKTNEPTIKKSKPPIGALRKLLDQQRAAEEARLRAEAEEKLLIEEEERKAAEEERRIEEQKQLKKERERAKKEQLKASGKYMTKKQKEQQKLAERRKEQMLGAGNIVVAGLEQADSADKPKRPVYGSRKKKNDRVKRQAKEETVIETPQHTLEQEIVQDIAAADWKASIQSDDGIKESWDMALSSSDKRSIQSEASEYDEELENRSGEEIVKSTTQKMESQRKAEAAERREKRHQEALAARSKDNLRSPICCILGHVDTGKTKLLDKIRETNVQEGEAGGITQQIGATYFPIDAIKKKTLCLNKDSTQEYKLPGLLVIDTPGHESFTNLRSRGSSLCNIAILVIDIMHGLEPQTIESLRLLKDRKTPFIVALNKIDRLYRWEATPDRGVRESLAEQTQAVRNEFEKRLSGIKVALAEQGLNSEVYWENKNIARNVSLVPTSAITGEGIPDMLMLLINLTQNRMSDKLMYLSELECTVLEVKVIEGLGTTIDVVLSNGVLHEGDRIVLCGLNGAIATNIRALLTPQPLKEMRVKGAYIHHKEVKAALGVKITAHDLEKAIAGSRLLVVGPDDDEEALKDEVMEDLQDLMSRIDTSGRGVCVQASTLGSLEALLEFLKVSKIPVSGINIGPVYKRDIMRAGTMLEKAKQLAVILCFDVKVDKDAEALAEEMGVKIFSANIIYHLFDSFTAYQKEIMELKRKESAHQVVFPCILKTLAVFNKKDPIVLGVDVVEGVLKVGTPLCTFKTDPVTHEKTTVELGRIVSMEVNHKALDSVKKGQAGAGVAIKIEGPNQPLFGRHLDESDALYSLISRKSIDTLKEFHRNEVSKEEWGLIKHLKPLFSIP